MNQRQTDQNSLKQFTNRFLTNPFHTSVSKYVFLVFDPTRLLGTHLIQTTTDVSK